MKVNMTVRLCELIATERFDAEFFRPDYCKAEAAVSRLQNEPIGELAKTIKRGLQPQYNEDGTIPVIRTVNVREGGLSGTRQQFVSEQFANDNKRALIHKGDIVITSTGIGTLGRVSYVFESNTHFADGHIAYLRGIKGVHPLFLTTFLQSWFGIAMLYRRQRGSSGQMEIYTDDIANIPIPVASKAEARIVELREKVLSRQTIAHEAITAAEGRLMEALELDSLDLSPQKCYTRRFRDLEAEARFDAEYFNPKYQRVIRKLRASGLTIADVAPVVQRTFDPSKRERDSTFNYIEIGSLTEDGEADAETIDVGDAPSRAKWIVKPGDIITSTVRPIRRLSALIRPEQDGYVCSSGFTVLTPKAGKDGIEPEVLLTYLRLPIICELLDLNCTASMYPAIPEDRLMRIPFVVPDNPTRLAIVRKVQAATAARREAVELLEEAKQTVEDLIANGENGTYWQA